MALISGEIGDLANLKTSFTRHSGSVDELLTALRSELSTAQWQGGAAERFRSAWESEYEPALRNLSTSLVEAGDEVGRRADALQAAGG
jgi:WXG100 family type VII secretion target